MYRNPARLSGGAFAAVVFTLVVAICGRGLWAAEQGLHTGPQPIDPVLHAIEHGHHHDPLPDHFYSEGSGIGDASHILFPAMGAIEHQMLGKMRLSPSA